MMNIKRDFLLPVLLAHSGNSLALDWLYKPDFSSTERYDDNITMQVKSNPMLDSMITTLSPGILLGYQTENDQLNTRFKWNELIYHNASALDFSEKMLTVNHNHQAEWFKTGLDAGYYEQSSINTQLDQTGSGVLSSKLIPRTTRSLSPNVLFNLSERNSLQFLYSYQDVAYQRPADLKNLNYSDYTNQQLSATATHSYSQRLSFNFTGSYSKFESASNIGNNGRFLFFGHPIGVLTTTDYQQNSTTFFYQAGFQYAVDEQTQLSLAAGMRDMSNKNHINQSVSYDPEIPGLYNNSKHESNLSSNSSGHVFSASLFRNFERGNISLNAGQQLNPSSSGQQQQTTSFSGQARYNLTERLSAGLNLSHMISVSSSTFSKSTQTFNRTYSTLTPDLQWRWTSEINLQLSYSYRQQENTDSHQIAVGNSIQLMLSYQPQINRQVK